MGFLTDVQSPLRLPGSAQSEPEEVFVERPEKTGAPITRAAPQTSGRYLVPKAGNMLDDKPRDSDFDTRPARMPKRFYRYISRIERWRLRGAHVIVSQGPTIGRGRMTPQELRANIARNSATSYGALHELRFPGGQVR